MAEAAVVAVVEVPVAAEVVAANENTTDSINQN